MYPKPKLTAYGLQLTARTRTAFTTVGGKRFAVSAARQRGWLMPVAAFIVVVMGLLAAGMGLVSSQTSIANAQEQISVQAFYAAEAGAQYGMNRLFYDPANPVSPATADANCVALGGDIINFTAPGMNGCLTTLGCTVVTDAGSGTSFYQINSAAQCGVGGVGANRVIDVSAYLQ